MGKWLLLAGAIVTEMTGTLALKAALHLPVLYLVVVAGYTCAFLLLSAALRRGMPLGVGYGIWGATGVAATAGMSVALFGEPLSALTTIGIVIVMGGVLVVEVGSHAASSSAEGDL